ncbi:hypothetical protein K458DRAFT_395076 [Lentithecium fluviatile CBS 122367]|uniref:Uncharacterized protein n=1 Tax=Lentithecium fluviatile CBS 122367 TaxID=1168545 RepID=A0A6G1IJE2_9PLEO|nr:hypothetical protein K458DRAFT_395076 [Lentithecium fluviatile CBS 122367]
MTATFRGNERGNCYFKSRPRSILVVTKPTLTTDSVELKEAFEPTLQRIVKLLTSHFRKVQTEGLSKQRNVTSDVLILTGGGSDSPAVRDLLDKALEQFNEDHGTATRIQQARHILSGLMSVLSLPHFVHKDEGNTTCY